MTPAERAEYSVAKARRECSAQRVTFTVEDPVVLERIERAVAPVLVPEAVGS